MIEDGNILTTSVESDLDVSDTLMDIFGAATAFHYPSSTISLTSSTTVLTSTSIPSPPSITSISGLTPSALIPINIPSDDVVYFLVWIPALHDPDIPTSNPLF